MSPLVCSTGVRNKSYLSSERFLFSRIPLAFGCQYTFSDKFPHGKREKPIKNNKGPTSNKKTNKEIACELLNLNLASLIAFGMIKNLNYAIASCIPVSFYALACVIKFLQDFAVACGVHEITFTEFINPISLDSLVIIRS